LHWTGLSAGFIVLALNPAWVGRVQLEQRIDWQVYATACGLGQVTPREIVQ